MDKKTGILLVEDEYISAVLMQKDLARLGYAVTHHSSTGEDAILSAKAIPPDLILMDIRLAGEIDGIEAMIKIKETADIPVIYLTGYDDRTIRERAAATDPIAILLKPVPITQVDRLIKGRFPPVNS